MPTDNNIRITREGRMLIVWHPEKHMLGCIQDESDAKKVRNKPCVRVLPTAIAKVFRFARFMNMNVVCDKSIEDEARAIVVANISRTKRAAELRNQYPNHVEFDYDYKGEYEPYSHQKVMFNMVSQLDKCAILAKVGACKTGPYLWAIDKYIQEGVIKKSLIVTLKPCAPNVIGEIEAQAPHLSAISMHGGSKRVDKIMNKKYSKGQAYRNRDYDIYITSYESVHFIKKYLEDRFDLVILDEAHRVSNPSSQMTKAITSSFEFVPRKYIVTGTLNANDYMSFFMPYRFLGADVVPYANYYTFRRQHFRTVDKSGFIWKPLSDTPEKVRQIQSKISVFFDTDDCMDLPGKNYVKRYCDQSPEQIKAAKLMEDQLMADFNCDQCNKRLECIVGGGEDLMCDETLILKTVLTKAGKLNQIASGYLRGEVEVGNIMKYKENPKLDLLKSELLSIGHEKVIIWNPHIPIVDDIISIIDSDKTLKHMGHMEIYGTTNAYAAVEKFKKSDKRYLIANPSKAGVGLNITEANYQIYFSNDYSLKKREQAEGRSYRGGQKKKVFYIDLICRNSIDEDVLAVLERKITMSEFLVKLVRVASNAKRNEVTDENSW